MKDIRLVANDGPPSPPYASAETILFATRTCACGSRTAMKEPDGSLLCVGCSKPAVPFNAESSMTPREPSYTPPKTKAEIAQTIADRPAGVNGKARCPRCNGLKSVAGRGGFCLVGAGHFAGQYLCRSCLMSENRKTGRVIAVGHPHTGAHQKGEKGGIVVAQEPPAEPTPKPEEPPRQLSRGGRPQATFDESEASRLLEAGSSLRAIGAAVGVSDRTVRRRLQGNHPSDDRPETKRKEPPKKLDMEDVIALCVSVATARDRERLARENLLALTADRLRLENELRSLLNPPPQGPSP